MFGACFMAPSDEGPGKVPGEGGEEEDGGAAA